MAKEAASRSPFPNYARSSQERPKAGVATSDATGLDRPGVAKKASGGREGAAVAWGESQAGRREPSRRDEGLPPSRPGSRKQPYLSRSFTSISVSYTVVSVSYPTASGSLSASSVPSRPSRTRSHRSCTQWCPSGSSRVRLVHNGPRLVHGHSPLVRDGVRLERGSAPSSPRPSRSGSFPLFSARSGPGTGCIRSWQALIPRTRSCPADSGRPLLRESLAGALSDDPNGFGAGAVGRLIAQPTVAPDSPSAIGRRRRPGFGGPRTKVAALFLQKSRARREIGGGPTQRHYRFSSFFARREPPCRRLRRFEGSSATVSSHRIDPCGF
jgi:hypothetical protein